MLRVRDAGSGEESEVRAREVVNAAGLHAPAVAATMKGLPQRLVPRAYFARGHYFKLKGAHICATMSDSVISNVSRCLLSLIASPPAPSDACPRTLKRS